MAVSSPPLPALSSLSPLFSQERSRRRRPRTPLTTSLHCHSPVSSKTQLSIRRQKAQNHQIKRLSCAKFSGDFGASNSAEDGKSNSQFLVPQEVKLHQVRSTYGDNGNGGIAREEPWWYRLPCVLGILLSGGESEGAPGGLYSLELEDNSTDRNAMSYAITFEDRVDATNFCYVLDTFFEDLNDVSAEIIPFTIQEIKEEVQSGRLNVVVVPKGKLKLYGSQTLEQVETELRSFLSVRHSRN